MNVNDQHSSKDKLHLIIEFVWILCVCVCFHAEGGLSEACDGIYQVLHIDYRALM